jgi:hypothetical protein
MEKKYKVRRTWINDKGVICCERVKEDTHNDKKNEKRKNRNKKT